MTSSERVHIETLVVSPEHNYVGHYGGPPGEAPPVSLEQVGLVVGRGLEGDRYCAREPGHPRQVTFFDVAVLAALSAHFGREVPPEAVRRNVFVRGLDLESLVGQTFELQGARFFGTESCRPCFWMDQAIGPGAEAFLEGRGGLRARILSGERLSVGPAPFSVDAARSS